MNILEKKWSEVSGSLPHHLYPPNSVGIELELESSSPVDPYSFVNSNEGIAWMHHEEDSLRHGFEMVLRKPLKTGEVAFKNALSGLQDWLDSNKQSLIISPRTSLHVHVNIQNMTFNQIYNVILHSYLYENILSYRCTANRKGNLFCMRGCDAEAGLFVLTDFIKNGSLTFDHIDVNSFKYGAINLSVIRTRGSIEFRFMDATLNTSEIYSWAAGLAEFVKKSADTDIKKTLDLIRSDTFDPKTEFKKLVGPYYNFFAADINFNNMSELIILDNVLGIINVCAALFQRKRYKKFNFQNDTGEVVGSHIGYNPMYGVTSGNTYTIADEIEDDYDDIDVDFN